MASLALGLLAAVVAVVVHELGHAIAGLAAGGRFSFLVVGPVMVERATTGRLSIRRNRSVHLMGGAVQVLPLRLDGARARLACVLAAGPLASVLFAVAAHATLRLGGVPLLARVELEWLRLLSGGLFVATALPLPNGPWVSDGRRLARVLSRGSHGQREIAVATITVLESRGVPPASWDPALIASGLAIRDGSIFECQLHLWSYQQASGCGEDERARAALERALALAPHMPAMLRDECHRLAAESIRQ